MTVLERYTVPGPNGTSLRKRYVSRVDWANSGVFYSSPRHMGLGTPWGNIILSDWVPFSMRPEKPLLRLGKWNLRWVRLKRSEDDS